MGSLMQKTTGADAVKQAISSGEVVLSKPTLWEYFRFGANSTKVLNDNAIAKDGEIRMALLWLERLWARGDEGSFNHIVLNTRNKKVAMRGLELLPYLSSGGYRMFANDAKCDALAVAAVQKMALPLKKQDTRNEMDWSAMIFLANYGESPAGQAEAKKQLTKIVPSDIDFQMQEGNLTLAFELASTGAGRNKIPTLSDLVSKALEADVERPEILKHLNNVPLISEHYPKDRKPYFDALLVLANSLNPPEDIKSDENLWRLNAGLFKELVSRFKANDTASDDFISLLADFDEVRLMFASVELIDSTEYPLAKALALALEKNAMDPETLDPAPSTDAALNIVDLLERKAKEGDAAAKLAIGQIVQTAKSNWLTDEAGRVFENL